jgi:hypothetical protein
MFKKVGSTGVFEVGSIVEFFPGSFPVSMVQQKLGPQRMKHQAVGWAIVVCARDGWVMTTRLEPMIECCGGMRPLQSHYEAQHSKKDQWVMELG